MLSFGPILLSKVLQLNETQQERSSRSAFKYADDKHLPLVDLPDLRALLDYLDYRRREEGDGGVRRRRDGDRRRHHPQDTYELEQQEADAFFGAPEFDVADFLRTTADGKGMVRRSSSWPTCRTGRRSSPPS